jgi:mono/diheme cytochrome c family protein
MEFLKYMFNLNFTRMKYLIVLTCLISGFLFLSFIVPQEKSTKPWDIPAEYLKMKNPQAADDAEMIKLGRTAYSKHCRSCHGNTGLGDGPKARQLETFPGDFSSAEFHALSDGELYYMSFIGRDEMPNYESKIPDEEERWAIITYMRAEFKK